MAVINRVTKDVLIDNAMEIRIKEERKYRGLDKYKRKGVGDPLPAIGQRWGTHLPTTIYPYSPK